MAMTIEEQIHDMVEKILREKMPELKKAERERASSWGNAGKLPDDRELADLSTIDSRQQLLVPHPCQQVRYQEMKRSTSARIGVWRTGTRPLTQTLLRFRADHAMAQDSVLGQVPEDFAVTYEMIPVQTLIQDKEQYLTRPDLGRRFSVESKILLREKGMAGADIQIVVSDGLSSKAVEANIPDLLPALQQGLKQQGLKLATPIFVRYGRVACMDEIGDTLKPKALILLIGERPGLGTAESLSAYMAYCPHLGMVESERTVISNIHEGGTPPVEAGAHLATVVRQILEQKTSGVNLMLGGA